MRVPLEIAQSIIDEVALADDVRYSDLKACSITCKAFAGLSQRHIFRSVSLTNYWPVENSLSLYSRFCSAMTPELALYVRELHIYDAGFGKNSSFLEQSTFPDTLGRIKNMTNFDLRLQYYCMWPDLTQSCRKALFTTISSPHLERLYFKGFFDVPYAVGRCITAIPTVHVNNITFRHADREDNDGLTYEHHPTIDSRGGLKCFGFVSLKKDSSKSLINAISIPGCRLRKLVLLEPDDYHEIGDYVEIAAIVIGIHKETLTDVEYLDRDIEIFFSGISKVDLSNFPRLRNLKLCITLESNTNFLQVAIQIISAAPKGNEVRKIHIELFNITHLIPRHVMDRSNGPTNWTFYDEEYTSYWRHLDTLFTDATLTQLEKVCFSLPGISREDKDSLLCSFLPKTTQKGLIEIIE